MLFNKPTPKWEVIHISMRSKPKFPIPCKEASPEYSNLLKGLWQEMDHYQCIQIKCSEDAVILKWLRIYVFLAGLNAEFDVVCVQILGRITFFE